MSVRKNIAANYMGSFVIIIAPILALPYYLHTLGLNNWGLVSFITLLQTLLSIFDAGASQSLVKEFASIDTNNTEGFFRRGKVFYSFERIYWAFALFVSLALAGLSDQIINFWLKVDIYNIDNARVTFYCGALIFFLQFPGSIYRSFLVGIQRQVPLNLIMGSSALIKHLFGIFLLTIWPKLIIYLLWQAVAVGFETLARGAFAWKMLGFKRSNLYWDKTAVISLAPSVGIMSLVTIIGVVTVQMDKIILSGMVSIEHFAVYSTASSIALGSLQLIYPVTNAVLPYLVTISHQKDLLRKFNFLCFGFALVVIAIGGVVFYCFGYDVLNIWLKNNILASEIDGLLKFLLIGTAFNVLYSIGYINWLVKDKFFKLFQVNLFSLVLCLAVMPPLIIEYGLSGASLGWILFNFTGFIISLSWIFSKND